MGIAAAAMSLAGCSKTEIDFNAGEGLDFEIFAAPQSTKTTDNGTATLWAKDDALTVFHAEAGSTSYGSNDKFSIAEADLASGKFTGTLATAPDGAKSYDWYVIYPYSSRYTTPANTTCYQQISNTLTQKGYGSTAHLSGNKFPLVGRAKAVAGGTVPGITMEQVCAVVKVVVTNNSGKALTVTGSSITSSKVNLAGGYFINFAGDDIVLVDENEGNSENDKYMFKTVSLTVTGGTEIPDGGTAALYFGVKPFTARNETIKIAVNGYEKSLEIGASAVSFQAGKIKTVNFNYDRTVEEPDLSGDYLITGKNGSNTYAMGLYSSGNNIKAISTPLAFSSGKVLETADIASAKVTLSKIGSGEFAGMYSIKDKNGKYLYAAATSSNYLKVQNSVDKNAAWTITADGEGYSIIATKSENRNQLRFNYNSGSPLFSCYASGMSQVSLISYSNVIADTAPSITLNKTSIVGVVAGGVSNAEEAGVYTLKNAADADITAVSTDGTVVTSASVSGGTLTYSVSANTATSTRSGSVTLTFGGTPYKITVSQLAAAGEGGEPLSLTFNLKSNPGSWPTANSTTLTSYIYKLDGKEYAFSLKNVKCNSGYLMLTATAVLGLPVISGYKLTKVVAKNSSSCSTTTKVGISTKAENSSYVTGGEVKTWSSVSSTYTYELSGTTADTQYYLVITNKNAQIIELTLNYE